MGLRIFLHAVRLVFSQLNDALRISGLLYLVTVVLSFFSFYSLWQAGSGGMASFSWQLLLSALVTGVIYLWIAVCWHRFVLLDEMPATPVPTFHGDRMLAYFGRGIQLALIVAVLGLVLGFANGMLFQFVGASPPILIIGTLIMLSIILLVTYRLAPVFPGAAVGRSVGVGAAWAATSGASGTLLVLAVVSAIAAVVIDLPAQLIAALFPQGLIVSFIWLSVTAWVKLMVGISILTALYGVYVEKRTIA